MKKVLFIDRDGTIIIEPEDFQIDSFEKLKFYPGAISALVALARRGEYELVMVSNQDGLGTESFPEEDFWPVQNFIIETLKSEGVNFSEILIDPSLPEENSPNRKPGVGMLKHYVKGDYDLANSFVIGDRKSDVELARNLGAKAIYLGDEKVNSDLQSKNWTEIVSFLLNNDRRVRIQRLTNETQIDLYLNLDGTGSAEVSTGIAFFDHMLDQIARHGSIDLKINCQGDLEVDEHHSIEDVGLALGEAFRKALASKKGLERYAFVLPMDEAQALVAIDFGGRPYFRWEADFKREYVGKMPTEMFSHFFKSFSDTAACTLHIKADGVNEHHKIEAIFKGFARVLAQASQRNASGKIPSTKGSL